MISTFRDEKARLKFLAAYEATRGRLWPVPTEELDCPTAFGTTRVYRSGRADRPPLVLLPGAGGNSLMWYHQITAWSDRYQVFAVDTIGEAGGSVQQAPVNDGHDGAVWLEEVLSALGLTGVTVVGCSYGGWLALHHALISDRTAALVLVDPAGFADPGRRFYTWMIASAFAGMAPGPLRRRFARRLANGTVNERDLLRLGFSAVSFRRRLPPATVFTDEQLRAVTVPSLFLLGARSTLHRPADVADRVRALMPGAEVEIVPDAGHALPMDVPALLADRVR